MSRSTLTGLAILFLAGTAIGDESLQNLFKACAPATVSIETQPDAEGQYSLGSGSILDRSGVVLTNHHVVERALEGDGRVRVRLYDGREFWGRIVESDERIDLALVHILDSPGGFSVLRLGDSDGVEVGSDCLAIGNPDGLSWSLSTGIISGRRGDLLQTTTPLNPGNSGGPLIGDDGRQIGVNTFSMYEGRDNIAFARTSNAVRAWIEAVGAGGRLAPSPTRRATEESDLSFVPPAGWEPMPARGALFRYKAPSGEDGRSPGYIEIKRVDRSRYRRMERLVEVVKTEYTRRYPSLRIGREQIFDYAGGEDNACFLEVSFTGRSVDLVESNLLLLGEGSIFVVKFVVLRKAWAAIAPRAYEAYRSVRWAGGARRGTERSPSAHEVVQALLDAVLAREADRFLSLLDLDLFFDHLTEGKYSAMDPPRQAAFRDGASEKFRDLVESGEMAAALENGVAILPGEEHGASAAFRIVTTGGDGTRLEASVHLRRVDGRWKVVALEEPRPIDPEELPDDGASIKTRRFEEEEGRFSLDLPVEWSTRIHDLEGGGRLFAFTPEADGEEGVGDRFVVQTIPRSDLAGRDTLSEDDLEKLRESIAGNLQSIYSGGWEVVERDRGVLGGFSAARLRYAARIIPIAPRVVGRLAVTFHDGVIFVVQVEVAEETARDREGAMGAIERSMRIPG